MAVPKKKRYKQIVRSRRTTNNLNLLKKKKINSTKYSDFINIKNLKKSSIIFSDKTCTYCSQNKSKNICLNCYTTYFLGTYIIDKGKK